MLSGSHLGINIGVDVIIDTYVSQIFLKNWENFCLFPNYRKCARPCARLKIKLNGTTRTLVQAALYAQTPTVASFVVLARKYWTSVFLHWKFLKEQHRDDSASILTVSISRSPLDTIAPASLFREYQNYEASCPQMFFYPLPIFSPSSLNNKKVFPHKTPGPWNALLAPSIPRVYSF